MVNDIRLVVTRKPTPPGQITLYKALYEADNAWVSKTELANQIRWNDSQSLTGIIGAIGNRVNQTKGLATQAPSGSALLLEKYEDRSELHYRMRLELRAVIDTLPKLKVDIGLSVAEIHTKYKDSRNWPQY